MDDLKKIWSWKWMEMPWSRFQKSNQRSSQMTTKCQTTRKNSLTIQLKINLKRANKIRASEILYHRSTHNPSRKRSARQPMNQYKIIINSTKEILASAVLPLWAMCSPKMTFMKECLKSRVRAFIKCGKSGTSCWRTGCYSITRRSRSTTRTRHAKESSTFSRSPQMPSLIRKTWR